MRSPALPKDSLPPRRTPARTTNRAGKRGRPPEDSQKIPLYRSRGLIRFRRATAAWRGRCEDEHLFREISSKKYRFMRPGIEDTFYGARSVGVIDPFNNRLRFNEFKKPR
ncbi:MAG TPA: glyoxalase superfamily protein [Myxococcaceae bacterium]|nr:glyoxalase superfamily protein [Myxococcaceae bacterium]